MHVHVLFDGKGAVHAVFHPSRETNAPQLQFHPARGQRIALLEVPVELRQLQPHELHAAVQVKVQKDGPRLLARKPLR